MTAHLIGRFEPGSPEWHAARAGGLGGSEVAPILGVSPFESKPSLWLRKAGMIGPVVQTEIMEAGHRLEPVIAQRFSDDHPEFTVRLSATYRHHERAWQIANPDRLLCVGRKRKPAALFEAKYALYPDHWGKRGTDEIPLWYRCQVQWYLDVFGLEICYLMVFIGSLGEFWEYVIHADPVDQQVIREAAAGFVESLATGVRPALDGHDATYEAIKELHPEIDQGGQVELPPKLAQFYVASKAAEKRAGVRAKHATTLIADHMGVAQYANFAGQSIARRQARGNGTPYVQAVSNLPDQLIIDEEMSKAS